MKKLLTILLMFSLLLGGLPAGAESSPFSFEGSGLDLDFQDVIDACPDAVNLNNLGVLSKNPYMSILSLEYCRLPKEVFHQVDSQFQSLPAESRERLSGMLSSARVPLAFVLTTDLADQDTAINSVFSALPEETQILSLGEADGYHYLAVVLPVQDIAPDFSALELLGLSPESAQADPDTVRASMETVRTAMVERLKSAKLYTPVDPDARLVGQILQFETTDLDGNPVTSEELFGKNRITLVNLWGLWCPHCVNEMSELAQIHARLQEKGCGVVGLEYEGGQPVDSFRDRAYAFLEERGVTYPNAIMPSGHEVFSQVSGYPTSYFVDSTGKILTIPVIGAQVSLYEPTFLSLLAEMDENAPAPAEQQEGTPAEEPSTEGAAESCSDGEQGADTPAAAVPNDVGAYRVYVLSAEGQPIPGVLVQFCDESTCTVQPTGEDGAAQFSAAEEKAYEVHVLSVPEGYASDETVYHTLDTFSDVRIVLRGV